MDKTRKILKSPSVKRRSRAIPINQRVTLERVLGLTSASNATFTCDPNSGTVAYPAGCVVVLINPRKGKQSHILNFSKKTLTSLAFSPDGKHIVTGESGHQPAVRVWNVDEKSQVSELHGHKFGVNCVAFSPNLKYLVSIGSQHDMMVNVWNWKTGTKVASNKVSSKVNAIDFSVDGSMFVTVGNRHVKFWYLDSSKSRINETVPLLGRSGILGEQKNNFFCDVVCGKGKKSKSVFSITQSGLLCEFNEKRLLDKWVELRTTSANCVSAGVDLIFIGCANGVVRVFSAKTLHFLTSLPHPHNLGVDVASALSPSQILPSKQDAKFPDTIGLVFDDVHKKVTCIYNDHSVYMWDVHDIKKVGKVWSFLYHSSCIWGLEVAPPVQDGESPVLPPGSFITCSSDDTIRIWNLDPHMTETASYKKNVYSNELLKICYIDPTMVSLRDVDYNPAGATDKTDTNYDGKNGIRSLCISPDGQHLASGDRIGNVRIHDLQTMKEIHSIEAHDGEVLCLEYSKVKSGPKLLSSTSRDRLVHVFDAEQKYGLLQTLDDHSASITAVKFIDSDSQLKMLSCGADKSLLFRNAQMSPDFQFSLSQHLVGKTTLYDMAVDPTQKFVATACQDRNIRIYNIKTAKQKKHYKGSVGDDGTLIKVQLDPSGSYAATSCTDKNLCILDFCSGELTATMYGHSELATGIKFTNDLKHFISVSGDGCIFVWRLSGEMSRQMQGRLEELGQLPVEALTGSLMNKTVTLEKEPEFKTPSKILAELTKEIEGRKETPEKQPLDYRFSVGQLPSWAKSKVGDEKPKDGKAGDDQGSNLPKGRWAQRVDNKGILAQLDGKKVELDVGTDRNMRKLAADDSQVDGRRETMVVSQPENTPKKIPVICDDEEEDDDDDDDFFPSFANSKTWDNTYQLRPSDSNEMEDLDLDNEVIYYPPSEDSVGSNGSSFTIFGGKTSTLGGTDKDSESTDPISEDIDDEEDSTGGVPSNPTTPSEDYGFKTPDREKFLKDKFENLSFTPVPLDKFRQRLDDMEEGITTEDAQPPPPDSAVFNSRLSISSRFLSRAQQANIKNIAVYSSIQRQDNNWFDLVMKGLLDLKLYHCIRRFQSVQKRKDEMARAVDETRKRLLAMGWNEPTSPEEKPVKLEANTEDVFDEQATPTNRKSSTFDKQITPTNRKSFAVDDQTTPTNRKSSVGSTSTPPPSAGPRTPKSLRRCWSSFDLPKTPIFEEKPTSMFSASNPNTPITKTQGKKVTACHKGSSASTTKSRPLWRSRIPTPTALSSRQSPRTASNRATIWDSRSSDGSEDSAEQKTPTNKTSGSAGRRSRPSTLTLEREKKRREVSVETPVKGDTKRTPRSHSHSSLYRQTESSKAKKSLGSSTNLTQPEDKQTSRHSTNLSKSTSMTNLSGGAKLSLPKSRPQMPSKKLSSLYTSTPNLIQVVGKEQECDDTPSNLKMCSDLSLSGSAPDLLDDEPPKVTSKKSSQTKVSKGKTTTETKRNSVGTTRRDSSHVSSLTRTGRLSLPASPSINVDNKSTKKSPQDKDLMPPPTKGAVSRSKAADTTKSKQDTFLKRAVQSKRKVVSELTLDQAKDILMGKSGILGSTSATPSSSSKYKSVTTTATTSVSSTKSSSYSSTFPTYTVASTSSVRTTSVSSISNTKSVTSSSISPRSLLKDPNLLQITTEIETTASEIRCKNMMEAAFQNLSELDASPNDLPERDCAPQQPSVPSTASSKPTSSVTSRWGDFSYQDLNPASSQSSPRSTSTAQITLVSTPSKTTSTASTHPIKSGSPVNSTLSPRSSSGIGSSLDSDAATKLFASPGSSLSPQSNYHLAYDISDSDDGSDKSPPQDNTHQSSFSSELDFGKSISLSKALEAVSGGHARSSPVTSSSSNNLPDSSTPTNLLSSVQTDWPTSSSRSTPSSVISNRSTVNGSPNLSNGFTPISPRKQDNLQICIEALKELRQVVRKVTDVYDQVRINSDSKSSEAKVMLEEAFVETQKTLADLVPKDSIDKPGRTEPLSIPKEVLEPMLSKYSDELLERVERLLTKRLTADKQ